MMTQQATPHPWQTTDWTGRYLSGLRAALPLASEQLDVMLYVIQQLGQPVQRFLDLGCGSGTLSRLLLDRYPSAHGVLVDFSAPMLDAARPTFDPAQVTLLEHNLYESIRTPAIQSQAPYQAIVSGYAIHHLSDDRKQSLYAEVFDLLGPGGIFINVEHVASPTVRVDDLFITATADSLFRSEQAAGASPDYEAIVAKLREDDGDIVALVEDQCRWLRGLGFADVDCYMKIYAFAVFGGVKPGAGR
ncbi:MAG: class I SAM-dependent methyltransferase [Anaerolineae bacterium]|nr:class I SAM-dependent methyltransferase [Anaerolineae bacterium]